MSHTQCRLRLYGGGFVPPAGQTIHELFYYPGESNLRMGDAVIINKIDTADSENILELQNLESNY